MTDSQSDATYFESVVNEIEAEAQRRSASGDYPRALLRSLDEEFRRWIPDASLENGVEDTIRGVEAAAYVDAAVPVDSRSPVGRYIKWLVRRLTYFYHRHMAQQITALGIHITRPLRLLDASVKNVDRRLSALEDRFDVGATARAELIAGISTFPISADFREALASHLANASGRVLFGDQVDPDLLQFLRTSGVDTYGVTSSNERSDLVDVRQEPLIEHLERLEDKSLGGFVLCGLTGRASLNEQLRALRLLLLRSKPDARVAVIVVHTETWSARLGPVAADLLDGRPLHPETWTHLLLREHALEVTAIESSDSQSTLITAKLP
ncbi:MAG: hypothetical protein VX983_09890 [Actinomycetota bacterium]|nr:hypothetical protein [Acidimicrobiales bacterium]MED5542382.1 hypothetical protein [Actinomycetota bacterium]